MTPFGTKVREYRATKGIALKKMAEDLGVTSAYFSALEHGHRGRPGSGLIPAATELANLLAESIHDLDEDTIEWVINEIRGRLGAGEKEGPTH